MIDWCITTLHDCDFSSGIYMKDLTFIMEGNPDFLKGGLINLTKRRQVGNHITGCY